MERGPQSFRMDFMPIFLFVYIVGSIGGALTVPIWVMMDPGLIREPHLLFQAMGHIVILFAPPYAALCAFFMTRYFLYILTSDGLTVRYLTGRSRSLRWDDVESVRPIQVGNLRYSRIGGSKNAPVVWLPLFVRSEHTIDEILSDYLIEGRTAHPPEG